MSDVALTEKQTSKIKAAIEEWRVKNNSIAELDLPDRDKFIKQLALTKSFLDEHKDVAFHYHCSGRGLPARFYHSKVQFLRLYESGHEEYQHLVDTDYMNKIEVNIARYKKSIARFSDLEKQPEHEKPFERGTPVFIASIHRQHGYNISLHKHTIATVLSGEDDRYFVEFQNGSNAFIKGTYLELANEVDHGKYTGWRQHKQKLDDILKVELKCADKALKRICEQHNVCLSVVEGQIVLVDKDNLENKLLINEQSKM